jgi:hypothetical protein
VSCVVGRGYVRVKQESMGVDMTELTDEQLVRKDVSRRQYCLWASDAAASKANNTSFSLK